MPGQTDRCQEWEGDSKKKQAPCRRDRTGLGVEARSSPVAGEEENEPENSRAHSWVDRNAADGHNLL